MKIGGTPRGNLIKIRFDRDQQEKGAPHCVELELPREVWRSIAAQIALMAK